MTDSEWRPLFARMSEEDAEDLEQLHEGIPHWLRESLWEWLDKNFISRYVRLSRGGGAASSRSSGYYDPQPSVIRRIERIARVDSEWTGSGDTRQDRERGRVAIRNVLYRDPKAFLIALDMALSHIDVGVPAAAELDNLLREGSSAWAVGALGSKNGLAPRLDPAVSEAAQRVVASGSRAGQLLAEAWNSVFSLQPNPTAGYRAAVRAVEAAAHIHVTPNDPRPSLGKMIAAISAKPDKWRVALSRDTAVRPTEVLAAMLQLLWTNEYSRHVGVDETVPLHITQEEAESAVVLSVTLVNWFSSGAVTLKPGN